MLAFHQLVGLVTALFRPPNCFTHTFSSDLESEPYATSRICFHQLLHADLNHIGIRVLHAHQTPTGADDGSRTHTLMQQILNLPCLPFHHIRIIGHSVSHPYGRFNLADTSINSFQPKAFRYLLLRYALGLIPLCQW